MKTTSINFTHTIPLERIADLLICALEGGSNHWIDSIEITYNAEKTEGYPQYAIDVEGWSITLYGKNTEALGSLMLLNLIAGLRLMSTQHPRHFLNFINEDEDADTGDVFLQLATFGELIYG
jgi:hypothetical protein